MIFSFIYTEHIADLTLKNNKMYQSIEANKDAYEIMPVNATIDKENIIPGLNGQTVNTKNSYFNMKDLKVFNSFYLIYDQTTPEISLENNKDKIISQGNPYKNSVAFVLEYDPAIIKIFESYNITASILVNIDTFDKNEKNFEQLNNETTKFNNLETILNKYNSNTHICYINNNNQTLCQKNKNYLVKTTKVLNKSNIIDIKNNITSGDIYYIPKNTDELTIRLIINSIMYKDIDIISLSKLISEERN
jgi:hypothetical protein